MELGFRQLNDRELELIGKLLEAEFPGRDELRAQLGSATAKQIEEDGTLSLRASGPPSPRKLTLAVEGTCKDGDDMIISVMLHVDEHGFMNMLEIYKYDLSPIINPPCARNLVLRLPEQNGTEVGRKRQADRR